jgi:hypothetical protein
MLIPITALLRGPTHSKASKSLSGRRTLMSEYIEVAAGDFAHHPGDVAHRPDNGESDQDGHRDADHERRNDGDQQYFLSR